MVLPVLTISKINLNPPGGKPPGEKRKQLPDVQCTSGGFLLYTRLEKGVFDVRKGVG